MNYKLIRSRRKTISIEITPVGAMIIRAPLRYSMDKIQHFIVLKKKWLENVLSQQANRILLQIPENIQEGTMIPYFGSLYPVQWTNQKEPYIQESFFLPAKWQRTTVQKKVIRWLKKKACDYLTDRTKELAVPLRIQVHSVTITHAKKRLGSCNRQRDIRYTWRILMLPTDLSDYIILHELAHIKVHSHGKSFWQILKDWIPDLKARKKLLKEYIIC